MTDQERQMIETLAKRIQDAPAPQIDRDADGLIRRTLGARSDALYILTQTVLIQEMALTQAKAQIDELKQRVASAGEGSSSFLGSSPSERGTEAGGEGQERVQKPGGYRGSSYQESRYPQPTAPSPQYAPPSPEPSGGGAFSGFLRSAATTAAGVVAGELAFSSLASIFGRQSGGFLGGGGGFFGGGSPASPVSETIINNYYEDDRDKGARDDRADDRARDEDRYANDSEDSLQDVSDDGGDDNSDDYSADDDTGDDDDSGSFDV
jgi:hypothetical protein